MGGGTRRRRTSGYRHYRRGEAFSRTRRHRDRFPYGAARHRQNTRRMEPNRCGSFPGSSSFRHSCHHDRTYSNVKFRLGESCYPFPHHRHGNFTGGDGIRRSDLHRRPYHGCDFQNLWYRRSGSTRRRGGLGSAAYLP